MQESVDAAPFVIDADEIERVDLTQIDFDALSALFQSGRKATAVARLQASLEMRLERALRVNPTRIDYAEKLREMIDRYNQGSVNIELFFEELKELSASLTDEEQRYIREDLTEEELTIFDLLTKPDPELTNTQEAQVKKVTRELLAKLKSELLVLDWKNRQATVARVRVAIEEILDAGLPDAYDPALFALKSAKVFEHVLVSQSDSGSGSRV